MTTQIGINDATLVAISTARYNPEKVTSRSVLEPYLDKVFFILGSSTGEFKSIRGVSHLLIKEVSAVLLTTGGVIEKMSHQRTFHFDHLWLPCLYPNHFIEGRSVYAAMPAFQYQRHEGSYDFGFRLSNMSNPADVFEMNFRFGLALLDLNLRLLNTRFEIDTETTKVQLRANIEALTSSTNLLENLYQTKKLDECVASRNLISFLSLWLEALDRPAITTSPKKAKLKARGFARAKS